MEYILTKADYEDVRVLIAITESLWENYQALANLEIMGKKETAEYQRKREQLHSTLGMEPTLYSRFGTDFPKISSIIKCFDSMKDKKLGNDRFETVLKGQKESTIIERIVRKIDRSLLINDEMKEEIKSMIEELGIDEDNEIARKIFESVDTSASFMNSYMEVESTMEEDKYACFLSILNKMIESPMNKDVRAQLIMMKYRMAFVCGKVEEMMLKQNFVVLPQVYLQMRTVGQLEKQSEFITAGILVKSTVTTIRNQTEILLSNYNDDALLDDIKKAEILTRLCMLRAGLLFLPPSCELKENERFHDFIDSKEYTATHSNNEKIEEMIMGAYRQYNRDKSIPITVSFVK